MRSIPRPLIGLILLGSHALSGCGTQINSLAELGRVSTGAGGVPATITSLSLVDGPTTNAWPLALAWGIPIGVHSQYCLLENSTNRATCIWHSGELPTEYEDSAADGSFRLTAYLKNDYGISEPIVSNLVTIDRTPPDLASVSVTNASPTNDATYGLAYGAVTGTYEDYCVLVNNTDRNACAWVSGTLPASSAVPTGDGAKTIRVWLRDAAGNVSNPVAAAAVTLDQTLPTLALTSLTGGQALVGGQAATITWTGSDLFPGATPIRLEYSVDSGANWTTIQSAIADSGSYAWTAPAITSTAVRVRVTFTDAAGNSRSVASTSDFSVNSSAPIVAVTSPDGGEIWRGGSSRNVTWTSTGLPAGGPTAVSAKIEYSLNNGTSWATAAAAAPNTGTYAWTLPAATDTTQALVRISVTDSFGVVTSDASNANFRIDSTAPTLSLTSLTGGQVVGGGAATAINWTGSDTNPGATPIKLEYSADSGANWTLIQDGVAHSGAYSWTTPAVTAATYRVRVTFTDAVGLATTAASTSDFAINSSAPIVAVTSPNGGEIWRGGSVHDVTWSSSGLPVGGPGTESVELEYSLDNGANWTTIVASTPNDGTYSWTLPAATNSVQALVRATVTDTFSADTAGVSNAVFAIDSTDPAVTLTSATGGQVIRGGAPFDVTWTASDTHLETNPISILVSSDGGANYVSLAANLPNSGTYSWSVPAIDSATYRLRVVALDKAGNSGESASASNFAIGYVPASISIVGGNNQSGAVGAALPADFVAVVRDASNRVIENVTVDWTVVSGGGSLAAASDVTDASGETANRLTLTTVPGANSVKATVSGYPSVAVTFAATGVPGTIHHFAFSGVPSSAVASDEVSFTVSAQDVYDNVITDYAGTVAFTSSDAYAILPANYTFVPADGGEEAPTFVFRTAGSQTITVTQVAGGAPANTSSAIAVTGTPTLSWNISTNDFGNVVVGQSSYTQDYYVQNNGVAVARGCAAPAFTGTGASHFTIVSQACGVSDLLPGASCLVRVQATPTSAGAKTATLRRVCTTGGTIDSTVSAVGITTTVTAVATGDVHTCALLSDGTVKCFGYNQYGRIGDGTSASGLQRTAPTSVLNIASGATAVAAGSTHSCAIVSGVPKCWGQNTYGAVGDGTNTSRSSPVNVSGITTATAIATSYNYTCALLADGTGRCWGDNTYSQLGDGTTADRNAPVTVGSLANGSAIATGSSHACAVLTDKTVRCWGRNNWGQIGDGTSILRSAATAVSGISTAEQIAIGRSHSCVRLTDGTVRCWGRNDQGQLGDGTQTARTTAVAVPGLGGVTDIVAFGDSTCALDAGGLKCWGNNGNGQLGDGTFTSTTSPIAISAVANVAKLAVGSAAATHNCVIRTDNTVRCWGSNSNGQLGNGKSEMQAAPAHVPSLATGDVEEVATGFEHSCAVMNDATVKCWGSAASGRLGDPALTAQSADANTVPGLANAVHVAAGVSYSCAVLSDGSVRCWGTNSSYQLGDGTATARTAPVSTLVSTGPSVALSGITQISAASTHTCARASSGKVYCWGANGAGQLGDGTTTDRPLATEVSGITNAVQVTTGYSYGCALLSTGQVSCWGSAFGSTETPAIVPSVANATQIYGGYNHFCVLLSDKTVKCLGSNAYGQIGDGTSTNRTSAVSVVGLANVVSISGSGYTNFALLANGSVKAWGAGVVGRVGDGSETNRLTPVSPVGLPAIYRLGNRRNGGGNNGGHSCAIADADRSLYCWGYNSTSQTGIAVDLAPQPLSGGL